jgi:hypothetical protein
MEYVQLSTLAVAYNFHFGHYNKAKKHVTQLIPYVVWKNAYVAHQKKYTNYTF